eukprot:EG_transcript_22768
MAHISRRAFSTHALGGKVAVITGGTSGIGAAAARQLAQRRCKVVVAGRSAERGRAVVDRLVGEGGEAVFVPTDVSREDSVRALMEEAVARYGTIDLLFNNAGVEPSGFARTKDFHKHIAEDTLTLQTNLLGPFWSFSHALPALLKSGGVVVNTSSSVSANGRIGANVSAYAAAKSALDAFTRHWALLYRKQGVRVYAVNPFFVATPLIGDRVAELAKLVNPSGLATPPEDVAKVVLAMFDGTTTYRSGDCVLVDAGPTTANVQVMYNLTTNLEMKNLQH